MHIRPETAADREAVWAVNSAAFDTPAEAELVDVLRADAQASISLVAERDGGIVGHILFSPVTLSGHPDLPLMGLGPMAVAPPLQRQGIGSALVRAGLEHCRQAGYTAVVVLGHPEFYRRFGFVPSTRFDIDSEYDVPADVFMVTELLPGGLSGRTGRVKYHPAFSEV